MEAIKKFYEAHQRGRLICAKYSLHKLRLENHDVGLRLSSKSHFKTKLGQVSNERRFSSSKLVGMTWFLQGPLYGSKQNGRHVSAS